MMSRKLLPEGTCIHKSHRAQTCQVWASSSSMAPDQYFLWPHWVVEHSMVRSMVRGSMLEEWMVGSSMAGDLVVERLVAMNLRPAV